MASVLRAWVQGLSFCKQGVLMGAVRGCDGITPVGPHKVLTKGIRMCCLKSGKLTGTFNAWAPTDQEIEEATCEFTDKFYDQLPMHFALHLLHAAEVIANDHIDEKVRWLWGMVYTNMVWAMHLNIETMDAYNIRLSDDKDSEASEYLEQGV